MKTLCEINHLLDTGVIGKDIKQMPAHGDVHALGQGTFYGPAGVTNAPDTAHAYIYQVFQHGTGDKFIKAYNTHDGKTFTIVQQGGTWQTAWKDTSGASAYDIWLKAGHTGNKAAFLASLKGAKGDKGTFDKSDFATHSEVIAGVNATKPINPKTLVWGDIMSKGGSSGHSVIPDKADLNTYVHMGIYTQTGSVNAKNGTNYPQDAAGVLTVLDVGGEIYQTYTTLSASGNNTYTRGAYSGTWSEWEKLMKASELYHPYDAVHDSIGSVSTVKNFDSLTKQGWYIMDTTNGAVNGPVRTGIFVYLQVVNYNDVAQQLQIAYEYGTNTGKPMAMRGKYQNVWGAWKYYPSMSLSGTTLTVTI